MLKVVRFSFKFAFVFNVHKHKTQHIIQTTLICLSNTKLCNVLCFFTCCFFEKYISDVNIIHFKDLV